MLQLKAGWPRLGVICTLVFRYTAVFLFLTRHCGGQSHVFGPSQPIVATVGDDIILPCHLEPAVTATDLTVEWSRPNLNPSFVHVWRDGVELESKKHPSYVGRTSVSINKLKLGDVSLKLYKVKPSDEGTYRCFIPTLNTRSTVELVVGTVSSLIIRLMRTDSDGHINGVILNCESKGWHPEPEVLWLDGVGNLLSAGPPETVRGPDDLYTVSSRVTVEKRHSNRFTCRVQQKNINQTREAHIHVADNIFSAPCTSAAHITISLIVVFMVIFIAVFVVWKWRGKRKRNITAEKTSSNNSELLLNEEKEAALQIFTDSTEIKVLDKIKANLDVQLKKVEEERIDVVGLVNILMNQKKDLDDQIYHTREQLHEVERQTNENHQLLSQTEHTNQAENNIKHLGEKQNEKELLDTKANLDIIKKELEKKIQDKNAVLKSIVCGVVIITERKKELDSHKEEINQHLEIEGKR